MTPDAWLGVVGGLLGVVVGWALTETSRVITNGRKARRELAAAAFVCLDRLLKIHRAIVASDDPLRDQETYYLGADMDRYRDCIAAAREGRQDHWRTYQSAIPILLSRAFESTDDVIKEFERVTGVADA